MIKFAYSRVDPQSDATMNEKGDQLLASLSGISTRFLLRRDMRLKRRERERDGGT